MPDINAELREAIMAMASEMAMLRAEQTALANSTLALGLIGELVKNGTLSREVFSDLAEVLRDKASTISASRLGETADALNNLADMIEVFAVSFDAGDFG